GDPLQERLWLFNRNITDIGKSDRYFALSTILTFGGWLLLKHKAWSETAEKKLRYAMHWGLSLLVCLITSGIVVQIIKNASGRLRPHRAPDFSPFVFDPFIFHWDWASFPSGHSQTLFAVATMICILFPKFYKLIFAVTFCFALTRVFSTAHFLSDVIMGSALGFVVSMLTLRWMDRKKFVKFDQFKDTRRG
ncbi:MAG: phosphatase PAP2 family protein, partial [Bdellovibrionota bacterium]